LKFYSSYESKCYALVVKGVSVGGEIFFSKIEVPI
jgi:hypothetical protein